MNPSDIQMDLSDEELEAATGGNANVNVKPVIAIGIAPAVNAGVLVIANSQLKDSKVSFNAQALASARAFNWFSK